MSTQPGTVIGDDVQEALRAGTPVVALESTIIAHGLPRPRNHEVALELGRLLRDDGVVPATVAVIDGVPRVGVTASELERIAFSDDVPKASVRDLPIAAARGRCGATTVAATAHLAARAGLRVFATGGLGGVHREARTSWDESADLGTLSRTRITVVCAGVKSILDIPATLERLETASVSVVGYRTSRFPGFYLSDSGYDIDWSVDGPEEIAAAMDAQARLETGALIVANPLPLGEQLDPALHDRALDESLAAAEAAGVRGKRVTPFLLDYLQRATDGESLEANIRAVRNNVRLGGAVARTWAEREGGGVSDSRYR
ncbi:MAG: pseudouridine-5'-phosphate glycosidase [Streptosporangiaceae bacterium]